MTLAPSGEQYELAHGDARAVVTEVGATLRTYTLGGVDVVVGFARHEMASAGHGQVLAPWPNRLGDGRYRFGDREGRAAWNEPERANAIHGLVRWLPWTVTAHEPASVTLRCRLHPQPAYPWHFELVVTYELRDDGLTVRAEATNHDTDAAPFGVGFHPYLTAGTPTIDTASLQVPARRRLVTDDRSLPVGDEEVAGGPFDFTSARPIGPTVLDTAFAELIRDDDDRATVVLGGDDGREVRLWVDGAYRYLMVFTGDTLGPEVRRRAVAVEPMTCPPDAFRRSGTDVVGLAPSARWSGRWGITPRLA